MIRHLYGEQSSSSVLVQMVDDHDLSVMDSEVRLIREMAGKDFLLIAMKVGNWNHDLTPWGAKAVFGSEDFGDGAEETLKAVLEELRLYDRRKKFYIGGYSLAGLFALWSVFRTDIFSGAACASPSVWYPGFSDFIEDHDLHTGSVYLSLGDREEKTRNSVMATVGEKIRKTHELLCSRGVSCTLEWNAGNHFRDPDLRTAKAFAWVMRNVEERSSYELER